MSKLLPCPFCGSDAEYWEDSGYSDKHVIECGECGCSKRSEYYNFVFEEWNTRYTLKQEPLDVSKVSHLIDELSSLMLKSQEVIKDYKSDGQ